MADRELRLHYEARQAFTMTLDGLNADAAYLTGRAGAALRNDQALELFTNFGVSFTLNVGAGPTSPSTIELFMYASLDDTPTWPANGFDGTDKAITLPNEDAKSALFPIHAIPVRAAGLHTAGPFSFEDIFQGFIPHRFGPFITHGTGQPFETTPTVPNEVFLSPMRLRSIEI